MKTKKTIILIFVAATFIFNLLTNANANLIVNGSFEDGPDPGIFMALPLGSTAIVGWTVTQDAIDWKGTYWVSSDGYRSLDLDNSSGFGGIMQPFNTTPGEIYEVTFDLAGNPYPDMDPPIKFLGVEAAGQNTVFQFDVTGHDTTNMGWETRTWQFTANSSSTTLKFYSLDSYSYGHTGIFGPALDNVSVLLVPEPTTLSLLCLGSLVLLRKRRA